MKMIVMGKVQGVGYREFVKKHADNLEIEGTIQNSEDENVVVNACGPSDNLEKLIDFIYKGTTTTSVKDVQVEPLVKEKDFRGVFRVIGN